MNFQKAEFSRATPLADIDKSSNHATKMTHMEICKWENYQNKNWNEENMCNGIIYKIRARTDVFFYSWQNTWSNCQSFNLWLRIIFWWPWLKTNRFYLLWSADFEFLSPQSQKWRIYETRTIYSLRWMVV